MTNLQSERTPIAANVDLISQKPWKDEKEYIRLDGSLQYLMLTRPNITFVVSNVAQFLAAPKECHWLAVKKTFRYLSRTQSNGITLKKIKDTILVV